MARQVPNRLGIFCPQPEPALTAVQESPWPGQELMTNVANNAIADALYTPYSARLVASFLDFHA